MIPSSYQSEVYKFIKSGKGNLLISAVAGSGKTTTIIESLKQIPSYKKVIFLVFNKSIQEELKTRVPKNIITRTFHSFGLFLIKSAYPNIQFDNSKFYKYSKIHLDKYISENFPKKQHYMVLSEYKNFIELLRNNTIEIPETLTPKKIDKVIQEILKIKSSAFDFQYIGTSSDYERGIRMLRDMNKDKEIFDFTDMIYLPCILKEIKDKISHFDYVMADECQDLNLAQQRILDLIVHPKTGRTIAVGDPSQSIYGFSGADYYSFENLSKRTNTFTLPLSVCYRCGTDIISYVKFFVKQIESFEKNEKGIIRDGNINEIEYGDMVLCRLNKNLISLFFSLLKQQKKSYIKGKDIGENLIKLIIKSSSNTITEFNKFILDETQKLKLKIESKLGQKISEEMFQKSPEFISLNEKFDCILELYNHSKNTLKSFQDLQLKIDQIFKDEGEGIILSTIHKAKGLENDRVFILDAKLLPIVFAKSEEELIQELNLYYVAITRAKKELVFINERFNRRVLRYLHFKEYEKLETLFEEEKLNINHYYFLQDLSSIQYSFSKSSFFYSTKKEIGFLTLKELKNV